MIGYILGYIGIMENKMGTTIIGYILEDPTGTVIFELTLERTLSSNIESKKHTRC